MSDATIQHTGGNLRVLGPPASGKTTLLLERFRRLEQQGKRAAVITYGRSRQEEMTNALLARDSARLGRVPVWTFPRLAREILSVTRPGLRGPLREVQELVLLDRAIDDLDGGLASDYRTISDSAAFRRALLDVVHTLLQNGVSTDDGVTAMSGAKGERARDILRVFSGFHTLLEERGMTTFYDAPWVAAREVSRHNPLTSFDALLIDDFGDIDAGQFELLCAVAPPQGAIEVTVFGDPSGARFGYRGTSERFLNDEFPRLYAPADVVLQAGATTPPHPDGDEQMSLFDAPHARECRATPEVAETNAVFCEDEIAEAQMIASRAAEILATGNHVCSDIAVIAREPYLYDRVLTAAFRDRGVPLDTGRRGHYAIDDYVGAWLTLLTAGVDERNALRLASSPLYEKLRAHAAKEAGLKERHAGGDVLDVGDIARWAKKKLPRGGFSMERFIERVVRPVLSSSEGDTRAMESLSHLVDEWGRYVEAIGHIGGKPELAAFRRAFASGGTGRRTDRDRAAVQLLSPLEATGQSFPIVFVAGCSEGLFPVVESGTGYIPFAELERAVPSRYPLHFHQARSREEKLRDEKLFLDSAMSRARKRLVLSAPMSFDAGETAAPCHMLQDAFVGADTVHRRESVAVRAARAVVMAGAGAIDTVADAPAGATTIEATWLAHRAAPRGFQIASFPMSPSRLSVYDECPRRLFYERVLGIRDEGSIYLTIGSLFHELVEAVGKRFPTRDDIVARFEGDVIREMVNEVCAQHKELGPEDSIVNLSLRSFLQEMAVQFREMEKSRVGGYRIGEIEMDESYEVAGFSFLGKIDRVDDIGGRTAVIDYKTGKMHRTGKSIRQYALGEQGDDRHWQIPMYLYGVVDKTGQWPYVFTYYAYPPDKDPVMVGLFIAESRPDTKVFADVRPSQFDHMTPDEVQTLMTEAVGITEEIFAEREAFPRTPSFKPCKNCFFKRLCMRYDA